MVRVRADSRIQCVGNVGAVRAIVRWTIIRGEYGVQLLGCFQICPTTDRTSVDVLGMAVAVLVVFMVMIGSIRRFPFAFEGCCGGVSTVSLRVGSLRAIT